MPLYYANGPGFQLYCLCQKQNRFPGFPFVTVYCPLIIPTQLSFPFLCRKSNTLTFAMLLLSYYLFSQLNPHSWHTMSGFGPLTKSIVINKNMCKANRRNFAPIPSVTFLILLLPHFGHFVPNILLHPLFVCKMCCQNLWSGVCYFNHMLKKRAVFAVHGNATPTGRVYK